MMPALRRSTAEVPDAQLVSRVLGGDHDAYATLVRRHQEAIYRHARGMGLDHDTSLDLVQEAFVRAYDRLADCRDGAHYRAWLFRICRNLCFDELRNVRRLAVPMSTSDEAADVEDPRAAHPDLTFTLRAALERLSRPLREAFLLKHDAGYTYEEIAVLTDASPSAVKMRVHRAREALQDFLRAQGFGASVNVTGAGDSSGGSTRLGNTGPAGERSGPEQTTDDAAGAEQTGSVGPLAPRTRRIS